MIRDTVRRAENRKCFGERGDDLRNFEEDQEITLIWHDNFWPPCILAPVLYFHDRLLTETNGAQRDFANERDPTVIKPDRENSMEISE